MTLEVIQLPIKKQKVWERISDNLVLHSVSGTYYVRKKRIGKGELFKSTGLATKKAAQTKADEMVAAWIGGITQAKVRGLRVNEVCDKLDQVLQKEFENGDRRKQTRQHDATYLPLITQYFGYNLISEVDEKVWDDWVRKTGKPLGRNLNDIAKYLSKVLTFAFENKYLNRKPRIYYPDKEKKSGMIYENEDIERFILHANPTLRDMIIIAAECGLRPHETEGLAWDWITFDQDCVTIHIPDEYEKRADGRSLEASDNVDVLLRRRFENRIGPYVFPSPKNPQKPISRFHLGRLWRAMLVKAKFQKGVRFHWLRHSFCSKALVDKGIPLAKVADYVGNSPGILMKRYLQNDPKRTREVATAVNLDLTNLGVKKE